MAGQYTRWPVEGGGGGGGSGTVTFVGMTVPSILTISGSPVTTTGTFAVGLANQSANLVFAGPSSGGAASPAFRALVAADIPALPYGTVADVTASSPLFSSGGTNPNITIQVANASQNGYLSSADWATFNAKQPLIAAGTTLQYFRGDKTFQTLDTLVVPENTNLYFTTARARATISASSPVVYNSGTGAISMPKADSVTDGYLSATDYNTFTAGLTGSNLDGGAPDSVYGGLSPINGGTP